MPHRVLLAALLALVAGACTIGAAADTMPSAGPGSRGPSTQAPPPQLKIAFVEDLSAEGAVGEVLPAMHGAEIALANAANAGDLGANVELVPVDTQGDPATAAAEIVDGPAFVGAIIAPFFQEQAAIAALLDRAGIPTLSLSSRGTHVSSLGLTRWRRLVAPQPTEARALARLVDATKGPANGVCVLDGTGTDSSAWPALVKSTLRAPVVADIPAPGPSEDVAPALVRVANAGCGVVAWGGSPEAAAAFRLGLVDRGLGRVILAGGDQLKQDVYLAEAGPAADRTLATCPCVDLSSSTQLSAQRFIQDYQSEEGVPPGAYAAEAWDAARMFVQAIRTATGVDRSAIGSALFATSTYDGLAGRYRFRSDGELADPRGGIHAYRVEGGRWIALERR